MYCQYSIAKRSKQSFNLFLLVSIQRVLLGDLHLSCSDAGPLSCPRRVHHQPLSAAEHLAH